MGAPRKKVEDLIVELTAEIAGINKEIDSVNEQLRENNRLPASRQEIEAELRAQIGKGAERFTERLRFEFKRPLDIPVVTNLLVAARLPGRTKRNDFFPVENIVASDSFTLRNNFQSILDGFLWLTSRAGDPAIKELLELAPAEGISAEEKSGNDARLRNKKRDLETQLEEIYVELETAGFPADRRPDLSPEVFLEWPKGKWREKLERFRGRKSEQRGLSKRLQEKLSELVLYRGRLNEDFRRYQAQGYPQDSSLLKIRRELEGLAHEEPPLREQLAISEQAEARSSKLFHACITFLKDRNIEVDHHL